MAAAGPVRSCCACRTRRSQQSLIRIRRVDAVWQIIQPESPAPPGIGRSAYVCPDLDCLLGLFHKGRLSRALKLPLSPSQLEELRLELLSQAR